MVLESFGPVSFRDHFRENSAGLHGRQLVFVPQKNELCPCRIHRLQELLHHHQVHHGDFIKDNHGCRKRIAFPVKKVMRSFPVPQDFVQCAAFYLQQCPVVVRRVPNGMDVSLQHFRHSLGRPAGGRPQHHLLHFDPGPLQTAKDRHHQGGFSRPRAPGDNGKGRIQGKPDSRHLVFIPNQGSAALFHTKGAFRRVNLFKDRFDPVPGYFQGILCIQQLLHPFFQEILMNKIFLEIEPFLILVFEDDQGKVFGGIGGDQFPVPACRDPGKEISGYLFRIHLI